VVEERAAREGQERSPTRPPWSVSSAQAVVAQQLYRHQEVEATADGHVLPRRPPCPPSTPAPSRRLCPEGAFQPRRAYGARSMTPASQTRYAGRPALPFAPVRAAFSLRAAHELTAPAHAPHVCLREPSVASRRHRHAACPSTFAERERSREIVRQPVNAGMFCL